MPIQTSQITTETNGDLTISPNGTGETKVTSVDTTRADAGTTEDTPVSVATDGTMKKVDLSTLPEVTKDNLVNTDLIAVQKADGDFYYIEADSLGSPTIIDPQNNATLTISPAPTIGDGSAGNPYQLTPITTNTPSSQEQTVETFSISGAPPNGILYVTFTDNQGGRFLDVVKTADASGNIAPFTLTFIDEPESTSGTTYTGKVRFGTASVYCSWDVTMFIVKTQFLGSDGTTPAPNGSPASVAVDGIFGTGSGTWADGAKTLSASGDIQFQVNGGGYGTGPTAAADNDTVDVIFVQSAVDAASEGDTISGTLSSADGAVVETFSMVKDISPTVSFPAGTNAALSSTQQSGIATPTDFNAKLSVTAGTAGPNEMTNIQVSIDGGAFTNLPQDMYPGQTLEVKGDVGSTISTTYTANINVGNTAVTYSVTTTDVAPTIQTPTITSPVNGSTGLLPDVALVSDAYVGNNGSGPHASSDWEVYEAAIGSGAPTNEPPNSGTYTQVVNSAGDTTNLTSYTLTTVPLDPSLAYYARVRYNDDGSTGSTITSDFSSYVELETASSFVPPLGDSYGGGFFGGQINDGGTIYNLIVSPVTSGSLQGQYGGGSAQLIRYKNVSTGDSPAATYQNGTWGAGATVAGAPSGHPMFSWCINDVTGPNAGTYDATNATKTGIGGYNDWYIPAQNELEILYYNLKPTSNSNNTSTGGNGAAVPPRLINYTTSTPSQTSVAAFRNTGGQKFYTGDTHGYWSATENGANQFSVVDAWKRYFLDGRLGNDGKDSFGYARSIRRVAE